MDTNRIPIQLTYIRCIGISKGIGIGSPLIRMVIRSIRMVVILPAIRAVMMVIMVLRTVGMVTMVLRLIRMVVRRVKIMSGKYRLVKFMFQMVVI